MKTLADGTQVSSRSYYYLLDFNDHDDFTTMPKITGKQKLNELNIDEYLQLFQVASRTELHKFQKHFYTVTSYGICLAKCPVLSKNVCQIGSLKCHNCNHNIKSSINEGWIICSKLNELSHLTCFDCTEKSDCEFAFDPYNTNGDCLAGK